MTIKYYEMTIEVSDGGIVLHNRSFYVIAPDMIEAIRLTDILATEKIAGETKHGSYRVIGAKELELRYEIGSLKYLTGDVVTEGVWK